MKQFYAHTISDHPETEWQNLDDHLQNVADIAADFAAPFGASEWAHLAGLWHDLGKYSTTFQSYLKNASSPDSHIADSAIRTDHSTAGAKHATQEVEVLGHLLAYVISGHHSGLLDGRSEKACLEARLKKKIGSWENAPSEFLIADNLEPPIFIREAFTKRNAFTVSFFTRMLFSCLVDADFIDTERFMDSDRAELRPMWPDNILQRMEEALDRYIEQLHVEDNQVDRERAIVRQACLDAAENTHGLCSLTVPTGGGKTLSSLAFALRHAVHYGLRRVIYVIPFTSIIEQNAEVFRKAMKSISEELGMDPVIEHHCNLNEEKETVTSRLATENWDAPLVVTTSVQFYESLFASRTSRCRKLHNMVDSVIILDEVQNLPVDYLTVCLRLLCELTKYYGATVVLCTATQPAVHYREDFPIGLKGVQEIIPDPKRLYKALRRVKVIDIGLQDDRQIVERLLYEKQVLCIVNTRGHARKIYEALGKKEGCFHLSALMCPAHRSEVIKVIRRLLSERQTCRVISTQLIEAGVDIDFPVVYRSLAGLDSIAQAAGRCNRNGLLKQKGSTYIFRSEHTCSERFFAETSNSASQVLGLYDDSLSLEAIEHYFRLYYWEQSQRWDSKQILSEFNLVKDRKLPFLFSFDKVAERFHLIEESGRPIIIPWDEKGQLLCEQLRDSWQGSVRDLLRKLQRYTVQIHWRVWYDHAGRTFELIHERYPVLTSPEIHYDENVGLSLDEEGSPFLNT